VNGYIGTDEAVQRLIQAIGELGGDSIPNSDAWYRYVPTAAEREARQLVTKRELAIELLYTALCAGTLAAWARTKSGALAPLVGADWKRAAFWRDILFSGVIHSVIGEDWARYEDEESKVLNAVLLDATAFEARCKLWLLPRSIISAPPNPQQAADPQEAACQVWLEGEMRKSPDRRLKTRDEYSEEAQERFRVSDPHFRNVIWPNAIANTGAQAWRKPGPQ
jgi:hypothetical protein